MSRTEHILFGLDYTLVNAGDQHHEGYRTAMGEVCDIAFQLASRGDGGDQREDIA